MYSLQKLIYKIHGGSGEDFRSTYDSTISSVKAILIHTFSEMQISFGAIHNAAIWGLSIRKELGKILMHI